MTVIFKPQDFLSISIFLHWTQLDLSWFASIFPKFGGLLNEYSQVSNLAYHLYLEINKELYCFNTLSLDVFISQSNKC